MIHAEVLPSFTLTRQHFSRTKQSSQNNKYVGFSPSIPIPLFYFKRRNRDSNVVSNNLREMAPPCRTPFLISVRKDSPGSRFLHGFLLRFLQQFSHTFLHFWIHLVRSVQQLPLLSQKLSCRQFIQCRTEFGTPCAFSSIVSGCVCGLSVNTHLGNQLVPEFEVQTLLDSA